MDRLVEADPKLLSDRTERATARLARMARSDTFFGGCRALGIAKRLERMKSKIPADNAVGYVYSTSNLSLGEYGAFECPECGSAHLGETAAFKCCEFTRRTLGRGRGINNNQQKEKTMSMIHGVRTQQEENRELEAIGFSDNPETRGKHIFNAAKAVIFNPSRLHQMSAEPETDDLIVEDKRSAKQKRTHVHAVVARDSFMSGWGPCKYGNSHCAWAFDSEEKAQAHQGTIEERDEMNDIEVIDDLNTYTPPEGAAHFTIYVG